MPFPISTVLSVQDVAHIQIGPGDGVGFTLSEPGDYTITCPVTWAYASTDSQPIASMTEVLGSGSLAITVTDTPVTKYVKTAAGGQYNLKISYDPESAVDDAEEAGRTRRVVVVADAATITIDAALTEVADITLAASGHTIAAPSNPADGHPLLIRLRQGGSGTNTVTFNAVFDFAKVGGAPTLSTAVGKVDRLMTEYDLIKTKWVVLAVLLDA